MTSEERRKELISLMRSASTPISGTELSKKLGVSRQVIVQDITILRAEHYDIEATSKGYLIYASKNVSERIFKVSHTDSETEDELNTIVDLGGTVVDVIVMHDVYGSLRGTLHISCRRHVKEFMNKISVSKSMPLKNLSSSNVHFHTVQADSNETLNLIENELKNKGYLVK